MNVTDSSNEKWSSAEEEIMQATYRTLLVTGHVDLTISGIADELGKSNAVLYYHYDSKDDLLGAFLDFAVDRFEAMISTEPTKDPNGDLERVIEKLLPVQHDADQRQFQEVLIGLRSQGVTNEAIREQFTRIDERLATTIGDIIERGIDEGTFRDVDSTRVAEHILAIVNGAMYGRVTTVQENTLSETRVSLSSYIDAELRRNI